MNDAENIRWAVRVLRGVLHNGSPLPDELTALADRLDGGVIVPRKDVVLLRDRLTAALMVARDGECEQGHPLTPKVTASEAK